MGQGVKLLIPIYDFLVMQTIKMKKKYSCVQLSLKKRYLIPPLE